MSELPVFDSHLARFTITQFIAVLYFSVIWVVVTQMLLHTYLDLNVYISCLLKTTFFSTIENSVL